MTAEDIRLQILQAIDRLQGDSSSYVDDVAIADELHLSVEEVQGHFAILAEKRHLTLASSLDGDSAFLTPGQRQQFRESSHVNHPTNALPVTAFKIYNSRMTRTLTGLIAIAGNINWQLFAGTPADECEAVEVQFPLHGRSDRRQALQHIYDTLQQNAVSFLSRRGQAWCLDLDDLRGHVPDLMKGLEWAYGVAAIKPEIEVVPDTSWTGGERTHVRFSVYKEEYILERQQKVFLSHKGADKPLVQRFFAALKCCGFQPWLDEDAMPAGTELERGILQGFKDSCAAVFFITPNFADEGYLRTEVNYAIAEKRFKGDRFAIITIVFSDEAGKKGKVPELLKQYVWKEPVTELNALIEILRALPIETGEIRWRV